MNATNNASLFLNELNAIEGVAGTEKLPPIIFNEALDEVRFNFVRAAKRELDALAGIEDHTRCTRYGQKISGWWEQEATGRFKVMLKDGTKVLELVDGKTYWVLPDQTAACRFLAAAIEAAEKKELDRFLTVKVTTKKASAYKAYLADVRHQRRVAQAANIMGDVSQVEAEKV